MDDPQRLTIQALTCPGDDRRALLAAYDDIFTRPLSAGDLIRALEAGYRCGLADRPESALAVHRLRTGRLRDALAWSVWTVLRLTATRIVGWRVERRARQADAAGQENP